MMKVMKAGILLSLFLLMLIVPSMSASGAEGMAARESEIVRLLNEQRTARKLPELSIQPALTSAASKHVNDMAKRDILSHEGSAGTSVRERIENAGYVWKAYGEIIGMEHRCDAKDMIALWLTSPRHAAIMLSADYREVGAAGARQPGMYGSCYWTVVFGAPMSSKKGAR